MNPTINTTKNKISVLTDLSGNMNTVLANAVELAKAVDGYVEVFYVKAPTDIVKGDNQLSAIRTLHKDNRDSESMLRALIESFSITGNPNVSYQIAYGNTKNSIKAYLANERPHIVVLGKPKSKFPGLSGGGIANFVLSECNVNVLVTGEDHKLHSFKDISLGVFDDLKGSDFEIVQDLQRESNEPLRIFSIGNPRKEPKEKTKLQNSISYVFSEGVNALEGLASYVKRTNTQLLCVPRSTNSSSLFKSDRTKQIVQKLDVPVLIMA